MECKEKLGIVILTLIVLLNPISVFAENDDLSEDGFWSFFSGLFDWLFPKDNHSFTFKNPIYKINTSCELAYLIQDNGLKKKHWSGMELETFMKFYRNSWMDAWVDVWNDEFGDDYGRLDENRVKKALKDTNSDSPQPAEQEFNRKFLLLSPYEQDLYTQKVETKTRSVLADKIIQESSINPAFKGDIHSILKAGRIITAYGADPFVTYLLETHKYSEDLECGKKYHEYFGDETFKVMEELWGSDFALERHNEIKKVLYG